MVVGSEDIAFKYAETRSVLSICDEIAGVYGLADNRAETWSSSPAVSAAWPSTSRNSMGDTVFRTGAIVDVPVGKELLGRVVAGIGKPFD